MGKRVLIVNGPNLNLLGLRENSIYGNMTLDKLNDIICEKAGQLNLSVEFYQSNYEGGIIDKIHGAKGTADIIIINPGAYTHYSYAIRDAIKAVEIPAIEIHISNIHCREEFRKTSVIAPVCMGQISGLGTKGYLVALYAAAQMISGGNKNEL